MTSTQWEPAPIAGRQRRRADDVRRVRDLLRQELAVLSAGTGILPDERLLALQLRASRNAVREALNLLRDEGFVERRQGRGTIVTTPPPHRMQGGRGLVNSVAGGERVHYEALWHHDAPASATVAEQLGIAPGDAVLVLERLTSIDGVPTCLWTSYLRRDEGLRVAATPCDGDGYELLEAALGIEVAQVDLCVEAVLADASVAEILQVRGGQPLLRLSRVITDATGRTVALGFGRALGNRMAMAFSSRRPARRRPADDASQHLG